MANDKHFSLTESLKFGFETAFRRFGFLLQIILMYLLVWFAGLMVFGAITFTFLKPTLAKLGVTTINDLANLNLNINTTDPSLLPGIIKSILPGLIKSALPIIAVFIVIVTLLNQYLSLGFTKVKLDLADHRRSSVREFLSQGRFIIRGLIASLLYFLGSVLGLALFVIPGIIFMITFGFYQYVLVDEDAGVIESFKRSAQITGGARWQLFVLGTIILLIHALVSSVFVFALIYIGPALALVPAYVYRKLKTEPAQQVLEETTLL